MMMKKGWNVVWVTMEVSIVDVYDSTSKLSCSCICSENASAAPMSSIEDAKSPSSLLPKFTVQ